MNYTLFFDGKAEPNPGKGSAGAVCYNGDEEVFRIGKYLSHATNNQAEYYGLIIGLNECIKRKITSLHVFGDSKLVIEQSAGRWKVNNEVLQTLNKQVKDLSKQFTYISFTHVLREKNTVADEITNIVHEQEKDLNESVDVSVHTEDMSEVLSLLREIRDLLKNFVENVVVE